MAGLLSLTMPVLQPHYDTVEAPARMLSRHWCCALGLSGLQNRESNKPPLFINSQSVLLTYSNWKWAQTEVNAQFGSAHLTTQPAFNEV